MKYFLLFLTAMALVGFILKKNNEISLCRAEELVNISLEETAKVINKKYHIRPCGAGVAMPEGPIRSLTLCFSTKKTAKMEELRILLIQSAKELVDYVINNEEIQPFLKVRPFTIENVQIIIYNHDASGRHVYDPDILTAEISDSYLTYRTVESKENFKLKNEFKETYEEALEKNKNTDK